MKIVFGFILLILLAALAFVFPQTQKESDGILEPPARETEKDASPIAEKKPVSLSLSPPEALQGEPVLITISGLNNPSAVSSLSLDGQTLSVFEYGENLGAIVGIDLHRKPGSYPIILTLEDGQKIETVLEVRERAMVTTEFDIPETLGGNTKEAERDLSDTLARDTATLNSITGVISPKKLWQGEFRHPLDGTIVVTDTYGYSRQTGSVNLSHNGTDFRAAVGTPVYAMNAGVIVYSGSFRNYGNTVIIDHGLGVMTMYMHLSEGKVELNQSIEKNDLIALSGNTGYSLGPHLHLSVRIHGYSIDPIKFLELLGSK